MDPMQLDLPEPITFSSSILPGDAPTDSDSDASSIVPVRPPPAGEDGVEQRRESLAQKVRYPAIPPSLSLFLTSDDPPFSSQRKSSPSPRPRLPQLLLQPQPLSPPRAPLPPAPTKSTTTPPLPPPPPFGFSTSPNPTSLRPHRSSKLLLRDKCASAKDSLMGLCLLGN